MTAMTPHALREIELLDAELWELPRRLSPADCLTHTGFDGLRRARNAEDEPREFTDD